MLSRSLKFVFSPNFTVHADCLGHTLFAHHFLVNPIVVYYGTVGPKLLISTLNKYIIGIIRLVSGMQWACFVHWAMRGWVVLSFIAQWDACVYCTVMATPVCLQRAVVCIWGLYLLVTGSVSPKTANPLRGKLRDNNKLIVGLIIYRTNWRPNLQAFML